MTAVAHLLRTWLQLDFFTSSRRGGGTSTLTTTILSQAFIALVVAALLYPETPHAPYLCFHVAFATWSTALVLLGREDQRDRRLADQVLLRTAPVPRLQLVAARALHELFFLCMLTLGLALPPAILLGMLTGRVGPVVSLIAAALLAAALCASVLHLVFATLERLLGGNAASLVLGLFRALWLGGGVMLFVLVMSSGFRADGPLPAWMVAVAAVLTHRWIDAPFTVLAAAAAAFAAIGALTWLLPAADEPRAGASRRTRGTALDRWLCRGDAPLLGLVQFCAVMLLRSPGYRMRALPMVAVPIAMVVLQLRGGDGAERLPFLGMALQFPAIYLPFLCVSMAVGDQPEANWLFEHAPPTGLGRAHRAAELVLVSRVLWPVHALALVVMLVLGVDPAFAVPASLCSAALATIVARAQVGALDAIPFTRPGDDSPPVGGRDLLPGLPLLVPGLLLGALDPAGRWALAAVAVGLASRWLRRPLSTPVPRTETTPPAQVAHDDPPSPPVPESLRRELLAALFVYGMTGALAAAVGALFAT